ncbi:MAG: nickel-responsive transcriptional regulator NikR [Pseudomonadota bacterium]
MERITISLDEALAREFDALIGRRGYSSRSEAVRDLLREHIEAARQTDALAAGHAHGHAYCVANLSYVYNHHARDLAERLTAIQHGHHDLTVATLHAHLDHDHCLESVILKGPLAAVRDFADAMTAERGVSHGRLNIVSVDVANSVHDHGYRPVGARGHGHAHLHLKPKNRIG